MNIHFSRKIASDELMDTLYFATGQRVSKVKSPTNYTLSAGGFKVVIANSKNISVNGDKCRSIREAKYVIQELL